jgi:hypothetical protein
MPLTKKERETFDALAARDKADREKEESASLKVTLNNGHTITLEGSKALAYAKRHGLEDDLEGDQDQQDEEDLEDEEDPQPGGDRYFGKKRK